MKAENGLRGRRSQPPWDQELCDKPPARGSASLGAQHLAELTPDPCLPPPLQNPQPRQSLICLPIWTGLSNPKPGPQGLTVNQSLPVAGRGDVATRSRMDPRAPWPDSAEDQGLHRGFLGERAPGRVFLSSGQVSVDEETAFCPGTEASLGVGVVAIVPTACLPLLRLSVQSLTTPLPPCQPSRIRTDSGDGQP